MLNCNFVIINSCVVFFVVKNILSYGINMLLFLLSFLFFLHNYTHLIAIPAFYVQYPLSIGLRSGDSRLSCPIAALNRTPLGRFPSFMSNSRSQSDTAQAIPAFYVQ